MREHPALWQLVIQNNGTLQSPSATEGIGLENMKERNPKTKRHDYIFLRKRFFDFYCNPKEQKGGI